MNYDFLRKHGDKVDKNGKCLRMLDFEDGGMYFGIVDDEVPSGLGSFVYSDLKFHCGYYSGGLMNDMSRIHFGNGDVYDGMTENGKMHGEGFFFDCQNNDWIFGLFQSDNCVEVIEHGEGFPRAEIAKFRSLYHQSSNQYYSRETEPLLLDLDLLIEYANKDISHLRPEIVPNSARETDNQNFEDDYEEEIEDDAVHDDRFEGEEEQSSFKAASQRRNHEVRKGPSVRNDPETVAARNKARDDAKRSAAKRVDSGQKKFHQAKRAQVLATKDHSKSASAYNSRKVETDFNPVERRMVLVPEVNTVSPSLLETESLRTPLKGSKEVLKKTSGNQIVQGANLIKPKHFMSHKEAATNYVSDHDNGLQQLSKLSNIAKINDISGVSSVRDRDESRDLRNISIQTEDKLADTYYKNDEASISYLKGIHSMIDELKQMVSDKIVVGRETEKVEESILFKISEVKKQVEQSLSGKNHPSFLESNIPALPYSAGSVLGTLNLGSENGSEILTGYKSDGSGLPPENRLPLIFNTSSTSEPGNFWNMTIDRQLEEKRLRDIEEALAKKFGKPDESEKQHSEILEPIKESVDGEEDDDVNNLRNSKVDYRAASQQRLNLGGFWEETMKEGSTEIPPRQQSLPIPTPELPLGSASFGQTSGKDSDSKGFETRGNRREPVQGVITEADERAFYTEEPMWGEDRRKSSWGNEHPREFRSRNSQDFKPSEEVFSKSDDQERKISNTDGPEQVENIKVGDNLEVFPTETSKTKEKSPSFGKKRSTRQLIEPVHLETNACDSEHHRESNFMYSRRGNESTNNGSLLPGVPAQSSKGPSVTPWFFLNPYLYEATYDIDMSYY